MELINKKPVFPYEVKEPTNERIVGRQIDTQAIIELIKLRNPITFVHGLVGIGKSAVVKQVGRFFSQRETFKDGVIYFSMRARQFVNILNYKIFSFIFNNKAEDGGQNLPNLTCSSLKSNSQHSEQSRESLPQMSDEDVENLELPKLT